MFQVLAQILCILPGGEPVFVLGGSAALDSRRTKVAAAAVGGGQQQQQREAGGNPLAPKQGKNE